MLFFFVLSAVAQSKCAEMGVIFKNVYCVDDISKRDMSVLITMRSSTAPHSPGTLSNLECDD